MSRIKCYKLIVSPRVECYPTPGKVRLDMRLYRTPKEQQKHIQKSLKRRMP